MNATAKPDTRRRARNGSSVAVESRLDLPHIEREQQRDQWQHQSDARSPTDTKLTEELRARQAVAERLALRQPEPARQYDQADQRDEHREAVHHAMHGLDRYRADQ